MLKTSSDITQIIISFEYKPMYVIYFYFLKKKIMHICVNI